VDPVVEVAEGLVRESFTTPLREQRFEHGGNVVELDLLLEQGCQTITAEPATKVDIVGGLGATNDSYFSHRSPGAAVGAAGHAHLETTTFEPLVVESLLESINELGHDAFRFGECLATRRQRDARERTARHRPQVFDTDDTVTLEDVGDCTAVLGCDAGNHDVLLGRHEEEDVVTLGNLAQGTAQELSVKFVLHTTRCHANADFEAAVTGGAPSEVVARRAEGECRGGAQWQVVARLDFGAERVNANVGGHVLHAGAAAVRAVTKVAVGGDDGAQEAVDFVGRDEGQGISQAGEGFGLGVRAAKTTGDDDVVALTKLGVCGGNKTHVLGEDVNAVLVGVGDGDFELRGK